MSLWGRLFGGRKREAELEEEIRAHLGMAAREKMEEGEAAGEAHAVAHREFGNVALVKEVTREVWGFVWLETWLQDLRYGVRQLRRTPGFTAVAVITLALGIGATTIMFAVVDAVLIRPLAYPHADEIVHLTEAHDRDPGMSIAYANFLDWQAKNRVFTSMGAIRPHALTLSGDGLAERLEGRQVSHDFLATLGVKPMLGRDFTERDDQPSAAPVVILSHRLWQRRYSGDPAVIGKVIRLDRALSTVIGVLPPTFSYNDEVPDALVPIGLIQDPGFWQNRYAHSGTYAVARLKPGVTLEQAQMDMDRVAETLQLQYPKTNARNWASLVRMRDWVIGDVRQPLLILLAAVGLLLLIASSNVANLLLAKGSGRARELALRLAVGASRGRLLRQFLTESVLLALVGGAAGVLLAFWGVATLVAAAPDSLPRAGEIRIAPAVLGFTFAVAVLTGILFGIVPALGARRTGPHLNLKEGERGSISRGQQRVRSALIVGQMALSLALLMGAGLLIRSFERVMQVDPGFNPHQLLTGFVVLSANKYQAVSDSENFYREAMRDIHAIPGVTAASAIVPMPMSGNEWDTDYLLDGMRAEDERKFPNTEIGFFGPDYLAAMELPLVAGRAFTEADNGRSLPVAIVNQEFARRNWPNQSPIGHRIRLGDPEQLAGPETADSRWQTVVGVIGDVKQYGLDERTVPTVYTPFAQRGTPELRYDLVIRAAVADPLGLAAQLRQAVTAADREEAIAEVNTMDHNLASRLATRRLSMVLLGIFAAVALALGAVGVYGVVSAWVAERTREIGIRVALGASRRGVMKLILARAVALLGVGLAAGVAASFGLTRLLQSMLFGVGASDPSVFAAVVVVLGAVAALACALPVRRATKVDPVVALRYE